MKLFIKRDKTVDGALFAVLDEYGENKYYVKAAKNCIVLLDLNGNTLLKIKRLLLPAAKTYTLISNDRTIRFLINPKKAFCAFYGISWHIRGDFFAKSFDIIDADNSVAATFSKRFNEDGYELIINCEHNEYLCLGVAICSNLESKVDNLVIQTV